MNRSLPLVCLLTVCTVLKLTAKPTVDAKNTFAGTEKLLFTENKGQVADKNGKLHPEILFTARTANVQLFITANGIQYQFVKKNSIAGNKNVKDEADVLAAPGKCTWSSHKMSVELAGANPAAVVVKEKQNEFIANYYLGHCPKGITGVHSYEKITVQNVYPHIDWVIYTKNNELEYDFIVHNGGKPSDIKLKIKDGSVNITPAGKLVMKTSLGQIEEKAPVSFIDGRVVASGFKKNNDGTIGFAVNAQPGKDLRIDPSVTWSTYYGGSGADYALSCAVDSATGNVYMAGFTNSSGLANGGYSNTYGGSTDAMLVKFNSAGSRLWATYFGGSSADYGRHCAIDKAGNVYLTGSTESAGLVSGGYMTTHSGYWGIDAFLVKFNSSGTRQWGTYYGGSDEDYAWSCATDSIGNVYIAGQTKSSSGIASSGSSQGNYDAFLVKFSSSGSRSWGTYVGGSSDDYGMAVTVSKPGKVYLGGTTNSNSGIATTGTYQTTLSTDKDGFLVQYNIDGTKSWGTYFGGDGTDYGYAVATDPSGNVYLDGISSSSNIASNGFDNTNQNAYNYDDYIVKFTSLGSRVWSSYLGGSDLEIEYSLSYCKTGCATDYSSNVYMCGYTASSSDIATTGSYQASKSGDKDAFMAKIKDVNVSLPVVKTTSLPNVVAGVAYTATIVGDSGTAPYTYSINYLPPGLSLNSATGVISGTSTISYSFTTVLKLVDSNGNAAKKVLTGTPTYLTNGSNFDINYYTTNWLLSDTSTTGFTSNASGGPSSNPTNSITNIMSGHTVTLNGSYSLQHVNINGILTNTSTNQMTFTVTGNLTGTGIDTNAYVTTIMSGSTTAAYLGGTSTSKLTIRNLTLDDTAGMTLIGNVDLLGKLTLSRGVLNTSGGILKFNSTTANNARLAAVTSGSINGNVTVERYIPAKRAWRMMTAPLGNTGSLYQNWQNNGSVIAGTGALIWKPSGANGFTAGGASTSLRQYNAATNAYATPSGTNNINLGEAATSAANNAFCIFLTAPYGSTSYITSGMAATTLKATGKIQTGDQAFTISSHPAGGYALIGNPYISAVNFAGVTKTNISNKFWAWDPQRAGTSYGGYVTVSYDAAKGVYDTDIPSSSTSQTQYIQNGQAVFVEMPTSATSSLTFHEADKYDGFTNSVFKTTNGNTTTLRTILNRQINGTMTEIDGAFAKFATGYDSATTDDALKFYNYDENMSVVRANQYLSIERRPEVVNYDTLFYNMYALKQNQQYGFSFVPDQWPAGQSEAWVVDRYLDSIHTINLQTTDSYSFTTSSAPLSYDGNRFYLVFHTLPSVPLSAQDITVAAQKQQNSVAVNWHTSNEKDLEKYVVEKSTDGKGFSPIGSVDAQNKATASYSVTDNHPVKGSNYYRVKITGNDGLYSYSKTVQVLFEGNQYQLNIFPNPATSGTISLSYSNVPEGGYQVNIYNAEGKIVYKTQAQLNGTGSYRLSIPQSLAAGRYELQLITDSSQNIGSTTLMIAR